ncbi:MAG: cytochrome c oxidase accessory protein CcoG, partial [Gammaproteobacteria bacterium]|nr:cytochrome c oxidase accessory protein CcoG [Gammaproteobacteria bacterium]
YECIACAACIDACDQVMDKMDYPRGLIRYTTQHAVDKQPGHVIRPRVIIYSLILLTVIGGFLAGIAARVPLELDVLRDRNALYRVLGDGTIENVYTLKILNKDNANHEYILTVSGLPGAEIETDRERIYASGGEVLTLPARIRVESDELQGGGHDIEITVRSLDGELNATEPARFFTPVSR